MKSKDLLLRLRKCAAVERWKIRLYHKGPLMADRYARRRHPFLYYQSNVVFLSGEIYKKYNSMR
jgi:hypothetical protein